MLRFKKAYFILTICLFVIEVLIARYVHDSFIRPWVGDFLVVILIYCFIRSFVNIPVKKAAIITLVFSYLVETLQYFNIVNILGLQHIRLARIIIGTNFAWSDIAAYTLGIGLVLLVEKLRVNKMALENKGR